MEKGVCLPAKAFNATGSNLLQAAFRVTGGINIFLTMECVNNAWCSDFLTSDFSMQFETFGFKLISIDFVLSCLLWLWLTSPKKKRPPYSKHKVVFVSSLFSWFVNHTFPFLVRVKVMHPPLPLLVHSRYLGSLT